MKLNNNDLQIFEKTPDGWEMTTLGEVLPISYGKGLTKPKRDESGGCPVYGSSGQVGVHSEALTEKPSLIIGRKGSVGEVHYSKVPCWPIDTVYFAEEREGVDLKFFEYLLKGVHLSKLDKSTAVPGLSRDDYNRVEVAIAPLDQQKLIVAEIEKQFSRLDEAVASLKRVKANLKRYKAAVLKTAVEGKLTEEWRKAHPDVEPASELLKRILEARRSQWKGRGKYKEPVAPRTSDLPELPKGWTWTRLDAIAALKGGITVDKKRKDPTARPVPYLRVANVQRGYLDLFEVKFIEASESAIIELSLQHGDILFNEGGDRDKLGRGWIWESQLADCIHQNHVFRARLFLSDMLPKFVSWWGNSFGKDYFLREGKQTTNLASINLTKLSAFPVPLPPLAEQDCIVAEVDRRLSLVREVESQVDTNLKRAERTHQSILSQTFSGHLIQHVIGIAETLPLSSTTIGGQKTIM